MKKVAIVGMIVLYGISIITCYRNKDSAVTKESTTQSTIKNLI